MRPYDWSVLDRLGSVWRTYTARGVRIAPEEHSVTVLIPTTAAGATSTLQTVTFPYEGQFVWYATTGLIVDGAGAITQQDDANAFELTPQAQMLLIRSQNGKTFARHQLSATSAPSGFAPVASITGVGQRPYILPFPVFFNPGDYLEVSLFNGGAADFGLQLSFHGWKLTQ